MEKKLKKSATDRKISGVCGGIAEYMNFDPTLVRLGWAALTLFSCGTAVLAYVLAAIIIPEPENTL